jgi:hypothetical protein
MEILRVIDLKIIKSFQIEKREELALKKCPDPNAKLSVELELQLLSEVQENER